MKVNWFGVFPVIQSRFFKKPERKVEPVEKSNIIDNNDQEEDNYSGRSNENDEERQDMHNYWKVFWKI